MSGVDLTEAVEAGYLVMNGGYVADTDQARWPEVVGILAAAAPLIEAQVREQVASEIIDVELDAIERGYKTYAKAMHRAARIARGQS